MTLPTLCLILALGFSGYTLIEARGRGLLAWAVFLIAVALLWPVLRGL